MTATMTATTGAGTASLVTTGIEGAYLKNAGAVGRPPGVEKIVFSGGNEPFAAGGELER